MKTTILVLIALCPALLEAQTSEKQKVASEVDRYIETVNEAAATFLDKSLPAAERIKAIEPHAVIYDKKQVEQFKGMALDPQESPDIRATAMRKIVEHVASDERLTRLVTQLLVDPRAPKPLREAALEIEASLSFMNMNVPDAYQEMLDDPELEFRIFAFTKLVIHGDARAQQRLIQGLENPEQASVPAPTAIGILSMAPKKEFYPAVFKVMQETKDPAARLEAIRVLGAYPEARQPLVAIAHEANEKPEYREAALGALYSGDRDNIVQYVTPIITDPTAPPRLQAIGIQMTTDVRQSMTFRVKAKKADDYDRLVQKLARDAKDNDVRIVANRYIETVKPRY
jgi:hypothetical protein